MFPLKQVMSKNYQHYPNWDTTGKGKMAWVCIIQTSRHMRYQQNFIGYWYHIH